MDRKMEEKGSPWLTSRQFGGSWDEIVCCCLQPLLVHSVWQMEGRRRRKTEIFGSIHTGELCGWGHRFLFFLTSLFLTSLSKCITLLSMQLYSLLKQVFSYRYSAFGQTLSTAGGPLHPEFPSVGCHSLYLKKSRNYISPRFLHAVTNCS